MYVYSGDRSIAYLKKTSREMGVYIPKGVVVVRLAEAGGAKVDGWVNKVARVEFVCGTDWAARSLSMHASYSSLKGVVGGGRGGLPARSVPFDPVGVR